MSGVWKMCFYKYRSKICIYLSDSSETKAKLTFRVCPDDVLKCWGKYLLALQKKNQLDFLIFNKIFNV